MKPASRQLLPIGAVLLFTGVLCGTAAVRGTPPPPGVAAAEPAATATAQPPTDPRYAAGIRAGVRGNLRQARRQMEQLAQASPGSNTGAWALYQAALAARAAGAGPAAAAHLAALQREYPTHFLAARTATASVSPPRRPKPDCGPRSLAYLCELAGKPASLPSLVRLCGTDQHGATLGRLAKAAEAQGFRAEAFQADAAYLERRRPTGIAWVNGDHYVAFRIGAREAESWLYDPNRGQREPITPAELVRRAQGIVLILHG